MAPAAARPLEQPKLRHRRRVGAGHNDVVEHLHVDELQRALQLAREDLVGTADLATERRVVVGLMCPWSFCALDPERFGGERNFVERWHITTRSGQGRVSRADLDGWLSSTEGAATRVCGATKCN